MIIGIDASKAASKKRTGVENTIYQIILNLKKIDQKNIYFLYSNASLPTELTDSYNFIEKRFLVKRFWNKLGLPMILTSYRPDVYLQPADMIPFFAPKKTATVIHDLASVKFPDAYSRFDLCLQKTALKSAAQKAKKIICVSESTRNDLIKLYSKTSKKAETVLLAFDKDKYKPINTPRDVLKLNSKYLLFVGRLEERKNVINIVKAFALLKEKGEIEHKLVLAGKPGFNYERIFNTISSLPPAIKKDIILPGYVSDTDMPDLLAGADVFVYPSLYEGFGIPILEAMSAGVPVVTANRSSMPEVAGDAALCVDPTDEIEITKAIWMILTDEKLRGELIKKGLTRAQEFSWEKTARGILDILEKL